MTRDANENYMISHEEPLITKKNTEPGKFVTNCLECNSTCHYPCEEAKGQSKKSCIVMKKDRCTKCPL